MRILLIDDEAPFCRALQRMLAGAEVAVCHSIAAAALEVLGHPPDAVVCDSLLPDGRGEEFLDGLKRAFPEIRCILMTGDLDIQPGAGTDAFLQKPFGSDELRNALVLAPVARASGAG